MLVVVVSVVMAMRVPATAGRQATSWPPSASDRLQTFVDAAVSAIVADARFGATPDDLAISLIDLADPDRPSGASHRGDLRIYPASVVKLFYLVAAHQWIEDGRLTPHDELSRALRDMIVDSSNDATAYVLDALTGTSSGVPLDAMAMAAWSEQRNAVNRYFASRGYAGINTNQKTWAEGPYGRDRAFLANGTNRNGLTTNATGRLLWEIVTGRAVTPARSGEMRALLARDWTKASADRDDQATGFIGGALREGTRLWSKAGWTSTVRHDAAYLELPDGGRYILAIFTSNHSTQPELIPALTRQILRDIGR